MAHKINPDICVACGTCICECPTGAISEGESYKIDPNICIDCGTCADACPSGAISPDDPPLGISENDYENATSTPSTSKQVNNPFVEDNDHENNGLLSQQINHDDVPPINSTKNLTATENEAEYIEEFKGCLNEGKIGPIERRLLNKIASQLGISSERASELETSLCPHLTEKEREYLEDFKTVMINGTVSEKDRRLLEKLREMYAISENRAREIEAM